MNATAAPSFPGPIGLGTYRMGESRLRRRAELNALREALEIGYRLIDTAELYGAGGAERLIGQALRGFGAARRDELFIVSKVQPTNASRRGTVRACEASLERLGCDYLDLYLLHWRGPHALSETLQAFLDLRERGLIRAFGVSNFNVEELTAWQAAERTLGVGAGISCNQVYYCLQARGIEFDLLPWQRSHGVRTLAYSPLAEGALAHHASLAQLAGRRGASAAQLALAWCVRAPDVVAIPKSSNPQRLRENWEVRDWQLTAEELAALDALFPPPIASQPLAMV